MSVVPRTSSDLDLDDFEMVEAAVRKTEKGRWFLDEFARRTRQQETVTLMASIRKIESVVMTTKLGVDFDAIKAHIDKSNVMLRLIKREIDKQVFPIDKSVDASLLAIARHLAQLSALLAEGKREEAVEGTAPVVERRASTTTQFNFNQDSLVFSA